MKYIPQDEIEWKLVKYLKEPLGASPEHATWKYEFWLNEPLASWDVFDYWESERIASMEKHLKKGDVLFDIGTEQGWCNLVYASIVGPENMVLIEPTQEFWPNIKALWDKNHPGTKPKGFYDGFFSDKTTEDRPSKSHNHYEWPKTADGELIDRNKYQYIHDNTENVAEITLDSYVYRTGIIPDGLTMDTEGSEAVIIEGAEMTLRNHHPKLWISIHDDMAERDYGVKPGELIKYLESIGYKSEYLATDHEAHWYFS